MSLRLTDFPKEHYDLSADGTQKIRTFVIRGLGCPMRDPFIGDEEIGGNTWAHSASHGFSFDCAALKEEGLVNNSMFVLCIRTIHS